MSIEIKTGSRTHNQITTKDGFEKQLNPDYMHNVKELNIWKRAIQMTTNVYMITSQFPLEEKYGLTSQIRRSAVSVPSNIAEGAGRNSRKEFCYFLSVSNGSSYELQTQLIISKNLELVDDRVDAILDEIDQLQKMNFALQKKLL